ncbi:scavenger receptor cysteine-rich type 1 protein M130-like [Chlamydotis macqueenii]
MGRGLGAGVHHHRGSLSPSPAIAICGSHGAFDAPSTNPSPASPPPCPAPRPTGRAGANGVRQLSAILDRNRDLEGAPVPFHPLCPSGSAGAQSWLSQRVPASALRPPQRPHGGQTLLCENMLLSVAPQVAGEPRAVDADAGSSPRRGGGEEKTASFLPAPPSRRGAAPAGSAGGTAMCCRSPRGAATCMHRGDGDLRLVGGGGRCAGRVEVKHNGKWGSVCNYDFDWEAHWATVVCRQLGCGPVATASVYAPFGQGTGRIWLQPFFCRGNQRKLQDCPHFGWGKHFCGHERDVGVTCREAVELRLTAGGGPCAGRLEVKLRGQWGSVADENWDMEDAEVTCQQLGCGSAAGAYAAGARFGLGTGPVGLALVDCKGNEATLWDCEIRGWGPYKAPHNFDTAVVCQGFARLADGDNACSGRLEVRQGRAWVSVCEDDVDIQAARVVCRELGCGAALADPAAGRFQAGTGPLWEGGFQCSGTEPLLSACARRPPRSQRCAGHAGIICSPYTGFRLANDSSGCAGRVEVEARGTWGSLCATGWDLPDAHVLCRHLGCGRAVAVPPGGSFGEGDGRLRRDAFHCSGNERHPGECATTVLGEPACPPGHAAAVNCSGVAEPLRLVEGESRCDGRLEVIADPEVWARVPAGLRDARAASVVCRQLDCGVPEKVYTVPGSGTAGLHGLRCGGTEETLAQCNVSEVAATPTGSPENVAATPTGSPENVAATPTGSPEEVAATPTDSPEEVATTPTGSPEEVAVVCSGSRRVRLAGGPTRCAGRVEVYVDGAWGTVCQDTWDMPDATVVCRQLGCGTALTAPGLAHFGPGTGPRWLDAGGCGGTEASLWDCPAVARRGCQRGGGAGAVCSEGLSLRLVGGSGRCNGHLEVLHNGTWGHVCAKDTSPATATAVCRQLGCGIAGRLGPGPTEDLAPAWLAWVGCEEGARSLWRCPSAPWRLQTCSRGSDTYIACDQDDDDVSGMPTPSPASRCPEGTTCTGVPSSSTKSVAASRTVSVPTILCVVLGTLLGLVLGAVAVQACRARARRRGAGRATDAAADAVYEELDYALTPEYQEVPSRSGSLSEGSGTKLPYYTGDSADESDAKAAPDSPALPEHSSPDGYDDAAAVPAESPAPGTGDISEGTPAGGSCPRPSPPGTRRDPPAPPPGNTDYDDVGVSTLGTSL